MPCTNVTGVFAGIDWSRFLRYCNVWGTPLAHDTANNNHGCRVRVCRRLPDVSQRRAV
jgi:hypothetical protein